MSTCFFKCLWTDPCVYKGILNFLFNIIHSPLPYFTSVLLLNPSKSYIGIKVDYFFKFFYFVWDIKFVLVSFSFITNIWFSVLKCILKIIPHLTLGRCKSFFLCVNYKLHTPMIIWTSILIIRIIIYWNFEMDYWRFSQTKGLLT
jgi:hypothetical protein